MKKITSKSDLQKDKRNGNKHTVRGDAAVAESLARYGAGRSILADKNGNIIAGNTTLSNWEGEIEVIPTDGSKLVVVQRTDLDLESDPAARELAHADNRTNQLGYDPDVSLIDADMANGADLSWLWREDELELLRGIAPPEDEDSSISAMGDMNKVPRNTGHELIVVFDSEEEMLLGRKKIQDLGYFTK
jgi:hypothetical protein